MPAWMVLKYVKPNGRCPIDEWLAGRSVTRADRIRLDQKVEAIEGFDGQLPGDWVKPYRTTRFFELKVRAEGKQLRPPCWVESGWRIILLCGAIEKGGKIPKGDLETADNLLANYLKGIGNVKPYLED